MTVYFEAKFRRQFDGGPKASSNCVPASLSMAAYQQTAGRIDLTGSQVRALVAPHEETNPVTPGWSLTDADLAADRMGFPFIPAKGSWQNLRDSHEAGRGIVLQGDSDQFTSGCSDAFDGDHAIYVSPENHPTKSLWQVGDPICRAFQWVDPAVLKRYAEKFGKRVFGTSSPQRISYGITAFVPKAQDAGGGDSVVIVDRYPFPAARVATGGTVTGYLPEGTALTAAWPAGGLVSATATVTRDDNAAPKGAGWLVGASRPFTGYLVPSVDLVMTVPPDPAPDCTDQVAAEHERTRQLAIDAVEAI